MSVKKRPRKGSSIKPTALLALNGCISEARLACFLIERYGTVGTWVNAPSWPVGIGRSFDRMVVKWYASTGLICHIISHQVKKRRMGLFVLPSHSSSPISFTLQLHRASEMFGNHQVSHSRLWPEPGAASSNPSETGTDLPAQRGAGGLDGKGSKILDSGNCC